MNYLWGGMILIGVIYGAISGNLQEVTETAISSAQEGVSLCITMMAVLAFWSGIMEIAQKIGLIKKMEKMMEPILSFLFPQVPKDHPARGQMATNIIANVFGLGAAATPAGLSAMEQLKDLSNQKSEDHSEVASDAMCDFLIINISSLQLIPVNVIAYRTQYGSANPSAIVGPAIAATLISTVAAVLFIKIRRIFFRKRNIL